MMPFILLLTGLLLIFLEFYLPGAVMGTAGSLLILASLFLAVIQFQSVWLIAFFFILVSCSVIGIIKYALWKIPRSKSIYLKSDQEGYVASTYDKSAIGKKAIVLSDLKPGGYILLDGKQEQAISESGYISQGEEVTVVRGEGESLIVIKSEVS
ncbi:MAG: NfeD family protein [Parachlamydiaceae bacterium]